MKLRFLPSLLCLLLVLTSCSGGAEDQYALGYDAGQKDGYEIGYSSGYEAGRASVFQENTDAGESSIDEDDPAYVAAFGKIDPYSGKVIRSPADFEAYQRAYADDMIRITAASSSPDPTPTPTPEPTPTPKPTPTPTFAPVEVPVDPPVTRSSTTVYITKTGSKYHRAGCSYLKKSKIEISLDDAKAQGYSACSRCW